MFSKKEYKKRLNKTKQSMMQYGIEVLVVSNPSNMCYLTGYDAWSFYVHQAVVVFIDEKEPLWIGRGMDSKGAEQTTWMHPQNVINYPDEYVQSTIKHPMDYVAEVLLEKGKGERKIGVEMDAFYYTAKCHERMLYELPDAELKDASGIVNWVRLIKSKKEISYMRNAGYIVEQAMKAAYDNIEVGTRENDVAAAIYSAQMHGSEDFGGDYPSMAPMIPTGEQTASPHLTWSDKRYEDGDLVTIEIAGCYRRYNVPMARTMSLGKADPKVLEVGKVIMEGIDETLQYIQPGFTAQEINNVWAGTIAKYGYEKEARIGYSIGLSYPPDWGEHTISLRQHDNSILEPNMVFHLMPGMWFDNFGVSITESFLVTDKGVELLTSFDREIYQKGIS